MGKISALAVFLPFILIGFVIEARGRKKVTSAVWLPLFWMVICASRSINQWLGQYSINSADSYLEASLTGSPLDRTILTIAIIWGIIIIYKRRESVVGLFRNNKAVFAFIIYLGISFLWSDMPEVSFRRWIRLVGDIIMATVLMTEPEPLESIRSVFRRCAYLLIPLSIMLIKYFPQMGVDYAHWSGLQMWRGVALHKNALGHLCFVSSFFLFWDALNTLEKRVGMEFSKVIFDAIILMMSLWLLRGPDYSYSSTSIACLILGVLIFIGSRAPTIKRNFGKIGVPIIIAICMFLLLEYSVGLIELIVKVMGRNMTFTDRVPLWNALIDLGLRKPILGYGYGGFWTIERIGMLDAMGGKALSDFTQAHSGYLELFVEGGLVAIILLGALLISLFRKIQRSALSNYNYAIFRLSCFFMILLANFTETSFPSTRTLLTFVFFVIALNNEPLEKDQVLKPIYEDRAV